MSTAAVALAEARRDIHELLYSLPAPTADKAREKLAVLEQVVVEITRERIATDLEKRIHTWPGMSDLAIASNETFAQAARIARDNHDY